MLGGSEGSGPDPCGALGRLTWDHLVGHMVLEVEHKSFTHSRHLL